MNIGIGISINNPAPLAGGPVYDSDYQAILTFASAQGFTPPSDAEKLLGSALMAALKSAATNGLSSYSIINVHSTNINYAGSVPVNLGYTGIDWAAPGTNQGSRTNTITQTVKKGYSSDGSTSYINTGINSNALLQNDCFFANMVYNITPDLRSGVTNGSYEGVYLGYNGSELTAAINGTAITVSNATAGTTTGGDYFIAAVRDNNADFDVWVNGVNKTTVTNASVTPVAGDIEVLSANFIGGGGRFFSNAANISGLTIIGKASEVDQAALYTAVNTYLTALAAL